MKNNHFWDIRTITCLSFSFSWTEDLLLRAFRCAKLGGSKASLTKAIRDVLTIKRHNAFLVGE